MGTKECIHLLLELGAQAVAAGEDALEEAQVHALQLGSPEQGLEQGGHAGDQVGLLLHQHIGVGIHAELGHQDAGGAANQGGVDADAQTEAMEHGHHGEHLHPGDFLHGEAGGGDGLQCQGVEIQVGEHDALGGAGGAAGIEDGAAGVIGAVVRGQGLPFSRRHHVVPVSIAGFGQFLHRPGIFRQGIQGA